MASPAEERFRALALAERLERVRQRGDYLGSRFHGGHQVHLYAMDGFFCEVWMRIGLKYVEFVEVALHPDILSEYVKLDPGELLDG